MKKSISTLAILFLFLAFVSCKSKDNQGSGQAYTLKMRLANGDKFGQDMDMEMDMRVKKMNVDMKMGMNMTMDMQVIGDSANLKKLKFTYTKAKMSMDVSGLPAGNENSRSKEAMDKAAERIEGKSIYIFLDKDNDIVDVIGFDQLMDTTYQDNTAEREQTKKMFSKDQLNSMMGMMFQLYPDHPVKVGDSWEKETDLSMGPIKMRVKNKYELKEVKNGVATVQLETAYKGKGKMEQGDMGIDMDMDGTQKGQISIGIDDGYMESADYKMDVKALANIMGQSITYNITGKYLVKGH